MKDRIHLLETRPQGEQAALVIGGPVVVGVICGVLLGISEAAYALISLLALAGAFLAGYEHAGARQGAIRGLIGGTLFGAFVLIAHELEGSEAKADLPHPAILLIVLTAVISVAFGALGGRSRARA
ncbi:MAG TPA: hypothetical protein VFX45_02785 [Solirubrobacterales bacterium]|nr:hypothetical protein [Solirubrobacterales bacterium]